MNLGLQDKTALVGASSRGLGKACALALAREGAIVTLTGRDAASLALAVEDITRTAPGARVHTVACDLSTDEGRRDAFAACPSPDILVTNNGGPPPGDFRDWSRGDWIAALELNMLAPIEMIKACVDPMIARRWGRIVNITSSAVKNPVQALGLSSGAHAGLTGFAAGLARSLAPHGVTLNNLLPGPHDTARMRAVLEKTGARITSPIGRPGDPADFGAVCAFLCSAQANFITGQNLLVDGGEFRGTF